MLAAVFGFDGTDHRADVVAEVGADVEALALGGHQVGPAVEVLDIEQVETRGVVVDVNLEGKARVLVDADLVGRHRDAHLTLSDLVARFLEGLDVATVDDGLGGGARVDVLQYTSGPWRRCGGLPNFLPEPDAPLFVGAQRGVLALPVRMLRRQCPLGASSNRRYQTLGFRRGIRDWGLLVSGLLVQTGDHRLEVLRGVLAIVPIELHVSRLELLVELRLL